MVLVLFLTKECVTQKEVLVLIYVFLTSLRKTVFLTNLGLGVFSFNLWMKYETKQCNLLLHLFQNECCLKFLHTY